MTTKLAVPVASLVAGLLLGWLLLPARGQRPGSGGERDADRDTAFDERMARLERQLGTLAAQRATNPVPPRVDEKENGAAVATAVDPSRPAGDDDADVARRALFGSVLARPDADPAWSREKESALVSAFNADAELASLFRGARCANDLCRIDFDRPLDGNDDVFDMVLMRSRLPVRGAGVFDPAESLDGRPTLYLAREGKGLPAL